MIYSCGLNKARLEVKLFTPLHPLQIEFSCHSYIGFNHDGNVLRGVGGGAPRKEICILTSNLILHWVLKSYRRENVFDKVEVVSGSDTRQHPAHRGTLLWQAPFFIILPFDYNCVMIDEAHRLTLTHHAGSRGGMAAWHEEVGRIWATHSSTTVNNNQ